MYLDEIFVSVGAVDLRWSTSDLFFEVGSHDFVCGVSERGQHMLFINRLRYTRFQGAVAVVADSTLKVNDVAGERGGSCDGDAQVASPCPCSTESTLQQPMRRPHCSMSNKSH